MITSNSNLFDLTKAVLNACEEAGDEGAKELAVLAVTNALRLSDEMHAAVEEAKKNDSAPNISDKDMIESCRGIYALLYLAETLNIDVSAFPYTGRPIETIPLLAVFHNFSEFVRKNT